MSQFYFEPRTKQAWLGEKKIEPNTYLNKYLNGEHYCHFMSGDKLGKVINFCVIWNQRKRKIRLHMKNKEGKIDEFFFAEIENGLRYKSIVDLKEENDN